MFGGAGMFAQEGGDVNAGAMDGEQSSGFGGGFGAMGQGWGGGSAGQGMPGGDYNQSGSWSSNVDPAETAVRQSEGGLKSDTNGQGVADAIGKSAGLFTAVWSILNPKAKRLQRRQRIYARNQAAYQLAQSGRNLDQFRQDSEIQRQKLQQSYAGSRGLGESSIKDEGMKYYNESTDRTMLDLAARYSLAQNNQDLVRSQISVSYMNPYLSFGNAAASMF